MSVLEWLSHRNDGLAHISPEERQSIVDFALLWMYFEARLVKTDAKPDTLTALVDRLQAAGSVDVEAVHRCYDYFLDRYFSGGARTYHFGKLRLTPTMTLVVEAGMKTPPDARGKLIVCLFVILRYRNNLFHGNKWVDGLEGQKENLDRAVQLLHAVIALDDAAKAAANA